MRSWSPNIQSQYVIFFFLIFLAALLGVSTNSHAQTVSTVTMTDTTVVGNNARAGLNLDQPTSSSPNFKNYYAFSNPGFEPVIMQQVYQFQSPQDTSSPTSFRWNASNAKLVSYDSNQWAGATFTVVQGSHASGKADPALGCSGTVKSSTNERGAGPVFVINPATNQGANGCAGELGLPGQVIIVSTNSNMASVFPTPASVWTGAAGLNGSPFGFSSTGGATIASETGDLCPSCGRQALRLTIPGGGSARLAGGPALNTPSGKSVTLNGTYTMSFWAKSDAAVPPKLAVTLTPRSGSACTEVYSGSSSPAITSTWTQFSFNCVFAETPSAGGSNPFNTTIVATSATGATTSLEFDNVSFTNAADTNPTAYSDAYVDAVQSWCQSTGNTTGPQCTLRYSASLASDSMSNWVEPQFERQPSTDGYTGLSNAGASIRPGLFDFLNLCAYVGATPVLTFPDSATTTDVQNLVDFLEGSASTTYGNIRASLGQMTPWVGASGSPFQVVYLEFGSQSWNTSALGNTLGSLLSTSSANLSLDYAVRAGTLFGAARAWQSSQGYTQSATKWVLNLAAFSTGDAASALQTSRADAGEVNAGTTYSIGNRSTAGCLTRGSTNATCPLYGPALTQAWANTHDASSQFYQSISAVQRAKVCGPSGTAACHAMLYQDNANAIAGAGSFGNLLQPVPNGFSQGGVQGVVAADLMGENDAAGIVNQNQFTDLQDFFQSGSANAPVLGSMIDIGGDCSMTNSAVFGGSYCPRPQMLGTQVYNWCKIGPMVQTSWTSNPVYNLPVNNNGVRAISNVPVLHSFAFEQGNERCMVIVNTDVYSAHTIMFSGANAPGNDVTTYQFAPSSLASTNQAIAGSDDGSLEATMWNTTTPSVNVSAGYSLPPHSVTAFKWEAGSDLSAGAATSLSPAGGTVSAHGVTPDLTAAATLVTTPVVNFPRGFAVNQNQLHLMGSAIYSGPALQLTNLAPSEMAAAWYVNPVNVQSFTSNFTFQLTSATADGFTFTIQNNDYISGYSGDYLGYGPNFTKSLAIKFDLYNNAGEGTDSTGLYTDGAIPTVPALDMTSSGVNLHSGDSMAVHLVYDGTTLSMTVTDLTTNASYTTSGAINIPSIVGGDTAYVGFTGGTGGSSAIQNILTWTYSTAATSTPALPAPTFSIAAGTYSSSQSVTLSDATAGTTIYYTTNGTTPTTSSTKYTGAITVGSTETLEAIAVETGYTNSPVATATYTIGSAVPAPTFSLPAGTYENSQVSITDSVSGATIYYTYEVSGYGIKPTTSSTKYTGPIELDQSGTFIIEAIAVANGTTSPVASVTYTIHPTVAKPVFSPAAGSYSSPQTVTISDVSTTATIYYTTNGSTPTTSSTKYSGPMTVSSTETINAIATISGDTNSPVATAAYTMSGTLAAPVFSVPAGTYSSTQTVTLSDATAGTTIYYTTNGSTPTTSSTKYTGAITVSSTETLEAIAVETGYTNSPVATAAYTINLALPAPTFSVAPGTYTASQSVSYLRRDSGHNHLLHHQRHYAHHFLNEVHRRHHCKLDGNPGSDRCRNRLYQQPGGDCGLHHRPGTACSDLQRCSWQLYGLAVGKHLRRDSGHNHLLHHQRQYAHHFLDHLHGADHRELDGNPGSDRCRNRLYQQPGGDCGLHHQHHQVPHALLAERQFDFTSFSASTDRARLDIAAPPAALNVGAQSS